MVYDPGSCTLRREFGQGQFVTGLAFMRTAPGDGFTLRAYGPAFEMARQGAKAAIRFGAAAQGKPDWVKFGAAGEVPFAEYGRFRLVGKLARGHAVQTAITPDEEGQVAGVTIAPQRGPALRFHTGSMRAPMAAMRACTDDLIRQWGYDPVAMAQWQRRPEPLGNPGSWATTADYPKGSLSRGESALVDFRLDISEDGKVSRCEALRVTGTSVFAVKTCQLVQSRARFRPALDSSGRPVRSFYINRVAWMIPTD